MRITDFPELVLPLGTDVLVGVDVVNDITKKIKLENLPVSIPTTAALNAKQNVLVSGTTIKTLNSISLLGSGDIVLTANASGVAGAVQFSNGSAFSSDASNLFWDNTDKRLGVGTNVTTVGNAALDQVTQRIYVNGSFSQIAHYIGSTANGISGDTSLALFGLGTAGGFHGGIRFFTSSNAVIPKLAMIVDRNQNVGIGLTNTSNLTASARLHLIGSGATSATDAVLVQNSVGTQILRIRDDGFTTIGQGNQGLTTFGVVGTGFVETGSTGQFTSSSRFSIKPDTSTGADGNIVLSNTAGSAFGILKLGGTTSAFPSIKRNAAQIDFRLADDSGFASISANALTLSGGISATSGSSWIFNGSFYNNNNDVNDFAGSVAIRKNVFIGGQGNASARAHIVGSGSTGATNALLVQNSGAQTFLTITDNGLSIFNGTVQNTTGPMQALSFATSSAPFNFSTASIYNITGTTPVVTSGQRDGFLGQFTFAPTSGTAVLNVLNVSPTINQTGGANGITRGLFIDPTLTAAVDFRAIEVTNGNVLIGNSASNTAKLSIKGSGSTSATTSLLVQNSAGTQSLKIDDDLGFQIGRLLGAGQGLSIRTDSGGGGINSGINTNFNNGATWNDDTNVCALKIAYNNGIRIANTTRYPLTLGSDTKAVASAQLEMVSTTQGFLMPRMTTTQINAIASPATGLEVFNTTLNCTCFYNGTGWRQVTHTAM
jgi:hypothetical protein